MDFSLLAVADIFQALVFPICIYAYVPQLLLMYRQKSSETLSISSYLLWLAGSLCATFYAVANYIEANISATLFFTTSANTLFCAFTLLMIVWYRRPSGQAFEEEFFEAFDKAAGLHVVQSGVAMNEVPRRDHRKADDLAFTLGSFDAVVNQ